MMSCVVVVVLAALAPSVSAKSSGKRSPRRQGRLLTELSCLDKHCAPLDRGQPEAGAVHWTTNFAQAEAEADASGKPIFVQFTAIPGSQTCQDYGRDVLSHSIIADLLEESFVPFLINTQDPKAEEILDIFSVSKLEFPAVHFVDADRREIAPPYQCGDVHGNLRDEADAVFHAAANALSAVQQPLPLFAQLMGPTGAAAVVGLGMESEWLVFTVGSFRSAEALLGALPAALSTEIGWCGGGFQNPPRLEQAVRMEFDSSLVGAGEIVTAAIALGFSPTDDRTAESFRAAKASDQKICLQAQVTGGDVGGGDQDQESQQASGVKESGYRVRALKRVALTPSQAMRANAACFRGASEGEYPVLSPRQYEQQTIALRLAPGRRTRNHHEPIHYTKTYNEEL